MTPTFVFLLTAIGTLMTISKYRRYAAECLLISDGTTDPQNRISLLAMAQAWLKLAQRVEQEGSVNPLAQPLPTEASSSAEATRTSADAAAPDRGTGTSRL